MFINHRLLTMTFYSKLCVVMGGCPDLYDLMVFVYGVATLWGILMGVTAVLWFQRIRPSKPIRKQDTE